MPNPLAIIRLVGRLVLTLCIAAPIAASPPVQLNGPNYEARFEQGAFHYYSAKSSIPDLTYQLRSIRVGNQIIRLNPKPDTIATREAVCFYYGDVLSESYTVLPSGIEQCWVINKRPRLPGDIVIEGTLRSPHKLVSSSLGFSVVSRHGRNVCVYGQVTVIDSHGCKITCAPVYADGQLSITIPRSFVDKAKFPILVDPVVGPDTAICPSFGPAPDIQENVEIAASPNGYLAVWQDARGTNGMDIFACRLSTTGQVLDPMAIAICNASGNQTDPDVAWNGKEFLVVWADRRAGTPHIYEARIRPNGEVLEKQGMLLSSTTGAQAFPRVTSDGSSWYSVWQETRTASPDIYGCSINADGSPQKIYSITTRGDNEETPDVAWNGSAFVVVWRDYRNIAGSDTDIYGCRVARNGIRMAGDTIVSCDSGGTNGAPQAQRYPRICGFGTMCMVVWEDLRTDVSNSDIYGARLASSPSFQVIDKNGILISNGDGIQEQPNVDFNGNQLLAAWRNKSTYTASGTRINTNGVVLDPSGIAVASTMIGPSGVAVSGMAAQFLTGFSTLDAINSNIVVSIVNNSGTVPNPAGTVASMGLIDQADYAVAYNGSEYAVVWSQKVNGIYDILAARVSNSGILLTPTPINVTSGFSGDHLQPAIAWSGSNYLVAWSGNQTYTNTGWDIRGVRLNSSLARLDSSQIQICTVTNDQIGPSAASNSSATGTFLVAWEDSRNSISPDYFNDIYGAIVNLSGTVTNISPQISIATGNQYRPKLAACGTNYLVVWEDLATGAPLARAARVTSAGQTQDAAGIALPATSSYQTTPEVCSGGNQYLVTWSDGYRMTGCRISTGGVVLDPSAIFIDSYSSPKAYPFACYNGANYQVVWEDYRSTFTGNADVYHSLVGVNGVPSSSPGTTLVSDLIPQLNPRILSNGNSGMLFFSKYDNYTNSIRAAALTETSVQELQNIAQAKGMPSGTPIAIRSKVVTGAYSGYFYCQELNRSCGIRVMSSVPMHIGDLVDAVGPVSLSDGERYVNANMVSQTGTANPLPKPLGMIGDSVGGGALNYLTPGITGAYGLNNLGLLVRTWGIVISSGADYFYIQIKPAVFIRVNCGSLTKPAVGKYVAVTGVSTCEVLSGSLGRAIRSRIQDDIQVLY